MKSQLFQNKKIIELLEYYKSIWALDHLNKLAAWDSEVYMPTSGAKFRGIALAKSQILIQQLILDKNFLRIVENCKSMDLNEYETALIRVIEREVKLFTKLPAEFLEDFEQTVSVAQLVWRKARNENNFKLFKPHLTKIVELSRKKAEYLGYIKNPYNALLDLFEEGLETDFLDSYFSDVIKTTQDVLNTLRATNKISKPHALSQLKYKQNLAVKLNHKLLKYLNYDDHKLRLDTSSHPFSEGLSTYDSRITTRYEGFDIARTVTSTIHEFGHALYFLQHHEALNTTPLYTNYSLALHESQSRFYENLIGRSKEFINTNLKLFHDLGDDFVKFNAEEFYKYFNQVKPSLIRVEADEVTYHAHIFIRYKIENLLLNKEIDVDEVPNFWNKQYEELLGIKPKTDSEGCLQDIHWSMGAIGYFPTYSLGTIFANQIAYTLENEIGDLSTLIKVDKGIEKINNWLKKNIHQYGAIYTFQDISSKLSGEKLNTTYWKTYMNNKYLQS